MKLFQGFLVVAAVVGAFAHASNIKVYSDRGQSYYDGVIKAYTAKTGNTVQIVTGSLGELKTRFKNGETGDLLLLKDIRFLADASSSGYFQKMSDANINSGVPAYMRDPQGLWTAVTYRVRSFVYDPSVIDVSEIGSYESISKPAFKGQLCIRNSGEYMPTMVAWLVAQKGEAKAKEIVQGWRNNVVFTAKDPESISMVEGGQCSVGIANHYYYLRAKTADERLSVEYAFTAQEDGGVHVNGFGGGVMKTASNIDGANDFLAFILGSEGSSIMIQEPSFEYPAVASNKASSKTEGLGSFKASEVPWSDIGAQISKGEEILESVGWEK